MIYNPCYVNDGTFIDPYDYTPYLVDIGLPVTVLNSSLLVLIVISYIPQLVKLHRTKSVHGISFLFLHISSWSLLFSASVFYITTLPQILACPQNPSLCYANMIPFLQSAAFLLGFIWWYALSIRLLCITQRKVGTEVDNSASLLAPVESDLGNIREGAKKIKCHVIVFSLFLIVMLSIVAVATSIVILYGTCTAWVRGFTLALSIVSLIFNVAQFSPQIYHTCKIKSPGSLSVLLSSIQFSIVLCMFIFAIMSKANWMTYLSMTSSTVQLFILTTALLIYTHRDKRKKKEKDSSNNERDGLVDQGQDTVEQVNPM